ncbi:MAG: molybdopterin molybdotransferase MoeA [Desulfobacterota bacterium]|nr:molybdopterin molybdotransferase MoeA [Thermodesulfobacteriota bacterium]
MKGFFKVQTPDQLLKKLDRFRPLSVEEIPLEASLHRVLAEDVVSSTDIPEFPRSTVDGFALRAKDTFGASEKNPALLRVVGEIPMGRPPKIFLKDGEAAKIATGGMIPAGADAVEMIEYTEWVDAHTIHAFKALSPYENVIQVGEDLRAGERLLRRGILLRPRELGLLAAIGRARILVYLRPKVGVLSSGDEIIPVEQKPASGEVRDINRYTISSMVTESGGIPLFFGIAKDRFEDLKEKIGKALKESDMVVITGGSSVGTLDLVAEVLQSFPGGEILGHGLSVRPGKPTLLAEVEGKPFLGLPGHPVSAMIIFHLVGKPLLNLLSGLEEEARPKWRWRVKAGRNIPSVAGREDYVRVTLTEKDGALWAFPLFGKSGAIAHLAKADGLLKIDIDAEGLEEGEEAELVLL